MSFVLQTPTTCTLRNLAPDTLLFFKPSSAPQIPLTPDNLTSLHDPIILSLHDPIILSLHNPINEVEVVVKMIDWDVTPPMVRMIYKLT